MIKFFRRIRKKLLTENKFSKYLIYAFGEIVLVMIGILLALQVNNWNEERIKKIELKEHLKIMVEDLNNGLENELEGKNMQKNMHEFRLYAMQYLLTISGNEPNYFPDFKYNKDFVPPEWLWKGIVPNQFDEQFVKVALKWMVIGLREHSVDANSAFDKIKNAGLYSYIEDPTLVSAIEENYSLYRFRFGESENHNILKYKYDWIDAMNTKGFSEDNLRDSKEVVRWLENSPEAVAKLRNLASNAHWLSQSWDTIVKSDKELIASINKYLIQNK